MVKPSNPCIYSFSWFNHIIFWLPSGLMETCPLREWIYPPHDSNNFALIRNTCCIFFLLLFYLSVYYSGSLRLCFFPAHPNIPVFFISKVPILESGSVVTKDCCPYPPNGTWTIHNLSSFISISQVITYYKGLQCIKNHITPSNGYVNHTEKEVFITTRPL